MQTPTIYIYDEETETLDEVMRPSDFSSLKSILYNLSSKDNGYLISFKLYNSITSLLKQESEDIKFHSRHIYENNGNFLKQYM
jgi:hypothetical protein